MITLLLPGFDGTGAQFAPLLRELPPELGSVVVSYPPDQPLGYNELTDLAAKSIPATGPWAMVAESFSGPVAVKLAARFPDRLAGLVLVASFVECPVRGVSRLNFLVKPVIAMRRNAPLFLLRYFIAGDDASTPFVAASRGWVAPVSGAVLVHRLRAVLAVNERAALRASKVPLLLLSGMKDRLVNRNAITRLHALRPDARLVTLDAPHMILQRKPAEAAAAIVEFLVPNTPGQK